MEFTQEQKRYEETVPNTEEGAKNITDGTELTDEQLEVVAGGTYIVDGGCTGGGHPNRKSGYPPQETV